MFSKAVLQISTVSTGHGALSLDLHIDVFWCPAIPLRFVPLLFR